MCAGMAAFRGVRYQFSSPTASKGFVLITEGSARFHCTHHRSGSRKPPPCRFPRPGAAHDHGCHWRGSLGKQSAGESQRCQPEFISGRICSASLVLVLRGRCAIAIYRPHESCESEQSAARGTKRSRGFRQSLAKCHSDELFPQYHQLTPRDWFHIPDAGPTAAPNNLALPVTANHDFSNRPMRIPICM